MRLKVLKVWNQPEQIKLLNQKNAAALSDLPELIQSRPLTLSLARAMELRGEPLMGQAARMRVTQALPVEWIVRADHAKAITWDPPGAYQRLTQASADAKDTKPPAPLSAGPLPRASSRPNSAARPA